KGNRVRRLRFITGLSNMGFFAARSDPSPAPCLAAAQPVSRIDGNQELNPEAGADPAPTPWPPPPKAGGGGTNAPGRVSVSPPPVVGGGAGGGGRSAARPPPSRFFA